MNSKQRKVSNYLIFADQKYIQSMKLYRIIKVVSVTILYSCLIVGCEGQINMKQCKFVEIKPEELQVDLSEIDTETGEVKMLCGDKIVNVPLTQFKRKLRVNPEKYVNNLVTFKREVYCLINESSQDKIVFCSRPSLSEDLVDLKFNYDD